MSSHLLHLPPHRLVIFLALSLLNGSYCFTLLNMYIDVLLEVSLVLALVRASSAQTIVVDGHIISQLDRYLLSNEFVIFFYPRS